LSISAAPACGSSTRIESGLHAAAVSSDPHRISPATAQQKEKTVSDSNSPTIGAWPERPHLIPRNAACRRTPANNGLFHKEPGATPARRNPASAPYATSASQNRMR